jgi:hypothetical protein
VSGFGNFIPQGGKKVIVGSE